MGARKTRNRNGSRLLERMWFFMEQVGSPMRTDRIREHYINTYGMDDMPRHGDMTQRMLKSGLFKRVGWFKKSTDEEINTTASARDLKEMGLMTNNADYICILEARPIEEIALPYLNGMRPLRRLSRQPQFVKDYVAQEGGSQ